MIRVAVWGHQGFGLDCFAFILQKYDKIDVVGWDSDFSRLQGAASRVSLDAVLVLSDLDSGVFSSAPSDVRQHWPEAAPVAVMQRSSGLNLSGIENMGYAAAVSLTDSPQRIWETLQEVIQRQQQSSEEVSSAGLVANGGAGQSFDNKGSGRGASSGLTDREQTVLKHLALGLSARDTAQILGLNSRTVDAHRRRVSSKLGLSSVAELTKHSIAVGLIDVQSDELYAYEHQQQMELA